VVTGVALSESESAAEKIEFRAVSTAADRASATPDVTVLRFTIELLIVALVPLLTPASVGAWLPVIVEKSMDRGAVSAATAPPALTPLAPPDPDTVFPVKVEFTMAD
jgi:hypothetical protein